jgi:putative ABC transport system permease protein
VTKWKRRNRASDVDRELAAHLELETDEFHESGLPLDEARSAARRAFGSTALVGEDVRAVWSVAWIDALGRDLRYAARSFRKNAGFTAVAVLTLALGIGANTAIFTALDALMLRPLPFPEPDRLVRLYATKNGVPISGFGAGGPSPLDVRDYAHASESFASLVAYDAWRKNVSYGDAAVAPEQMRVGLVPAAYFQMLGIQPIAGRFFSEDENAPGKNFVAAISAELWRTRFSADRAILGRTLRINDEPYTIVAVMPDVIPSWMEANRAGRIDVWTPFAFPDVWSESSRATRGFAALGRLKPGVTLERAQAELSMLAAGLAAAHPVDRGFGVALRRVVDTRAGSLGPLVLLLMGAVSLILLIACVNLANLLLARNSTRQRELALRTALGAGRGGLVRQLLAETMLLSIVGGALGLMLARVGVSILANTHPANLPQLDAMDIDWRVLAFTLCISIVTSLLFGLAPALSSTRVNLIDALKQGGRSGAAGLRSQRMRNALIVVETAMSLMLIVGASLVMQSISKLERQNLGIRADHLLKGHLYLPGVRYPDAGAITRFSDEFARRVRELPGVIDATVTTAYPPTNGWTQMLGIPGHEVTRLEDIPSAQFGLADAHFVSTMGIPLVRGRNFSEADASTSPPVALISAEFSRRYFPSEDPIGRRIHIGPPASMQVAPGANTMDAADVTIVGIVGDFRNAGLALQPEPHITALYSQHPLVNYGFKDIVIRTASEPRLVAPLVARQLHQLDADLPFAEVQTMGELVEEQTGGQHFTAILLAVFAAAGLVLAIVGIYGVVSFIVAQRKQELAVRMAVGASHGAILWLVLTQSLRTVAIGAAIGLVGAAGAQRLTSGFLFGISPVDPLTFASAAALLLAVSAVATAIPGVRAMRIDPARTLYQD